MSNKIIILIPHYNNIKGLCKSLSSIKYNDGLDVLIVDDGSDIKVNISELYKLSDSIRKIYLIEFQKNKGIEHALNAGLLKIKDMAEHEYVARLDCGDIVLGDRFYLQCDYLEHHPNVYLIGSWVKFIDSNGNHMFSLKYPTQHNIIKNRMYIANMFIHPSVMFRLSSIDKIGYYSIEYKYAEDYDYFFKFVNQFETANLPYYLVACEYNPAGISISKRNKQLKSRITIIIKYYRPSIYWIYGFLRNLIVYMVPYSLISFVKRIFFK